MTGVKLARMACWDITHNPIFLTDPFVRKNSIDHLNLLTMSIM